MTAIDKLNDTINNRSTREKILLTITIFAISFSVTLNLFIEDSKSRYTTTKNEMIAYKNAIVLIHDTNTTTSNDGLIEEIEALQQQILLQENQIKMLNSNNNQIKELSSFSKKYNLEVNIDKNDSYISVSGYGDFINIAEFINDIEFLLNTFEITSFSMYPNNKKREFFIEINMLRNIN